MSLKVIGLKMVRLEFRVFLTRTKKVSGYSTKNTCPSSKRARVGTTYRKVHRKVVARDVGRKDFDVFGPSGSQRETSFRRARTHLPRLQQLPVRILHKGTLQVVHQKQEQIQQTFPRAKREVKVRKRTKRARESKARLIPPSSFPRLPNMPQVKLNLARHLVITTRGMAQVPIRTWLSLLVLHSAHTPVLKMTNVEFTGRTSQSLTSAETQPGPSWT